MEGSSFEGDCEFYSPQTIVLVGRKGNGKSATGNNILGTKLFRSERSSSVVTTTCESKSTTLKDCRKINVIDTPGIDINCEAEILGSCADTKFTEGIINMVGDGIHAFLVVLSIRSRFSTEEEAVIRSLLKLFGGKICNYMIFVFTGGDLLEKDDETLQGFLHDCPEKLKEFLRLCENRCVLFDNKTEDQTKRSDQVEKLFSVVDIMSRKNDWKLYTIEMFTEWKKETMEQAENSQALKESKQFNELEVSMRTDPMHNGQLKRIIEMVEPKMNERTLSLERQLAEERAARLKAEEDATVAQQKSDEEIRYIREQIEIATKSRRALRNLSEIKNALCVIL
ncbi:putative AIG1-type guanine nucleotide-binding (G) domain-containing protein [Helianthus annuus]|uniref:Putative avirulence induced gene (AIG1) family protein n=1 Tax=Helianthus annuus TaxID=4232 RepID=A0A251VD99_HELAN|nr:immune-associated nucleotide-binding protein 9 isoform X2 [Helianthus annuus]KAJ0938825.1 putative AIG1-type guanine nucleotide-binding (G) domain-containing protein [Helianthus annuus]